MVKEKSAISTRKQVYQLLRHQIINSELQPGTALSENDLASDLGVSRTPIREALIKLVDEGLIQVFPKVGTFVSKVDIQQVKDAQFLREAVEVASLVALPDVLDPSLLSALKDNLDHQREVEEDLNAFFGLDEQFHEGLLGLGGHAGVWPAVAEAKAHLDRARFLSLRVGSPVSQLIAQHQAIYDALVVGDKGEAARVLKDHVRIVFTDIGRVHERSPEFFQITPDSVPVRRSVAVWK